MLIIHLLIQTVVQAFITIGKIALVVVRPLINLLLMIERLVTYEELPNVFHSNAVAPVQAQDTDGHSEMVLPGDGVLGGYYGHSNAMTPVEEQDTNGRSEMVLSGNGMLGGYYGRSNAMAPVQAQNSDCCSEMVLSAWRK